MNVCIWCCVVFLEIRGFVIYSVLPYICGSSVLYCFFFSPCWFVLYCLFLNVMLWLTYLNSKEYKIKIVKGEVEYSCKEYYSGLVLIVSLYFLILLGLFVIGLFIVVYGLFVYSLWSASVSYWFSVYCLLDIVCSMLSVTNGLIFFGLVFYSAVLVFLLWLLLKNGNCEFDAGSIIKCGCKVHYSGLVVIMSLYCLLLVVSFCCGLYYVVYDISV